MLNRIRNKIAILISNEATKLLISFNYNGYFVEKGWLKSTLSKSSVDKLNRPIPWVTYSFIDFFVGKAIRDFSIFEFGSGNSTLFWYTYTRNIHSVEHHKEWYHKIKNDLPADVKNNLMLFSLDNAEAYTGAALNTNRKFDIIFVDGRRRVACAIASFPALSDQGVLILDDSERPRYQEAVSFYQSHGYKKLDFWGIAPGVFSNKCTSIFYKSDNIFSI